MPLPQVSEVVNHAGTILILLILTLGQDLVKQFFGAHFRRRERIILSQERDVIANRTFMTISSVVDQDRAIFSL